LNVPLNTSDISACHRLPKSKYLNKNLPKRTIIKFVNRKKCEKLKMNKKNLPTVVKKIPALHQSKIYFNDNLSPAYRSLWWKSKQLYNAKLLSSFWTFNGIVNISFGENDNVTTKKILHYHDLQETFPDFKFE